MILAPKAQVRLEIDSVLIFLKTNTKGGKKENLNQKHSFCEKLLFPLLKLSPPSKKSWVGYLLFYFILFKIYFHFSTAFFFVCAIQLLYPLLWSFSFLIFHRPFMRAVKVQRSNRQLTWDSCANTHSNLLTYHHYHTYHPDHCRMPALKFQKAPPQKSLCNVPHCFLLTYFLLLFFLLPPSHLSLIFFPFQALKPFQFYGCYTFS